MVAATVAEAVLDEKIWRAWVQKGKLQQKATTRKARIIAIAAIVLAVISGAFYLLAVK